MLLIVFYHCICPYGVWTNAEYSTNLSVPIWSVLIGVLSSIHLPMFFVLAGYLFGYKRNLGGYGDIILFAKGKFLRVVIPYIFVGLLIVIIQKERVIGLLTGISHLWFLMTIFECYIAGRVLDKTLLLDLKYKKIVLLICFVTILVETRFTIDISLFTIKQFCIYFPIYFVGMILGSCPLTKNKRAYTLGLAIGSFLILIWSRFYPIVGLSRISGFVFVISIFLFMRSHSDCRISASLTSLDKCSMGVYIVHHILIQEMNRVGFFHSLMISHYILYPIIQFALITLVSWYMVQMLQKNRITKYIVG